MDLSLLADSAEKFDANGCAVVFAYMQLKAKSVVFFVPLCLVTCCSWPSSPPK